MGSFKTIFTGLGSGLKSVFKTADSKIVKTTSSIVSNSPQLVTGGKAIVKSSISNFAQGAGTTAKIGGKVFGATAIVGGVGLAGSKIYDYLGDTFAVTSVQREYENQIKLAGDEATLIDKQRKSEIDYLKNLNDLRLAGVDTSVMGASGGAGSPIYEGIQAAEENKSDNTKLALYVIGGIAALGLGTYIYKISKKK